MNILIEKLQKYQPYHQAKLKSMNILQVKKYYVLVKKKVLKEQAKKHSKNKQKQLEIKEKKG